MDPNSGKIYPNQALSPTDKERLVEIPEKDETAVRGMNRPQRRAWGTVLRQTKNRKLAYEAAKRRGWAGQMPPAEV